MIKAHTITPCLWFDTQAEEAVNLYISIFKGSRIGAITRYGDGAPMPKGTVLTIEFELFGRSFTALNGGPMFKFTEAVSLIVSCDSQAEIDDYWQKLLSGGGKPQQCGWLKDRFGLSWQVVPSDIAEMMSGSNSAKVMHAILKMVKLDMATLRTAAGR